MLWIQKLQKKTIFAQFHFAILGVLFANCQFGSDCKFWNTFFALIDIVDSYGTEIKGKWETDWKNQNGGAGIKFGKMKCDEGKNENFPNRASISTRSLIVGNMESSTTQTGPQPGLSVMDKIFNFVSATEFSNNWDLDWIIFLCLRTGVRISHWIFVCVYCWNGSIKGEGGFFEFCCRGGFGNLRTGGLGSRVNWWLWGFWVCGVVEQLVQRLLVGLIFGCVRRVVPCREWGCWSQIV